MLYNELVCCCVRDRVTAPGLHTDKFCTQIPLDPAIIIHPLTHGPVTRFQLCYRIRYNHVDESLLVTDRMTTVLRYDVRTYNYYSATDKFFANSLTSEVDMNF